MNCPSCGKIIPDESTFCEHCGNAVSTTADERLTVECALCGGTGKIKEFLSTLTCNACHGKGNVQVMPPPTRCPLCSGSGRQEGFINKPVCGVCWGTGWANVVR
jgi:DnaJ-class molecular chaperone